MHSRSRMTVDLGSRMMHGRSLQSIDPRILAVPGRSASGFHTDQTDVAYTKREAS